MNLHSRVARALATCLAASSALAGGLALAQPAATAPRPGDYIVAVINQDLVTAAEVQGRLARMREDARRANRPLPPEGRLRQQVVDALIDERVQLSWARDSGTRVDDAEVDRAVASVAAQNQLTVEQLRTQLAREGMDFSRFRSNVRDQILLERVREREVAARIRITDSEVEDWLEARRRETAGAASYDVAQILVRVPEGASESEVAERRARAEQALARSRAGEPFVVLARELSDDATTRDNGGRLGLRPADRLPEVFLEAVRGLQVGQTAPALVRSGAGFHVLRLAEKRESAAFTVPQTRVRHILLRPSAQAPQEAALRRLAEFRRQILGGRPFEQVAREHSEDGSAQQGGDLGWATPGNFVPEFEQAMARLEPGALSEPVVSRFGVHLIQVLERREVVLDARQQREIARNVLREQKFEEAYLDWIRELRARAYIEMREPPA
jgi:peptidyl-prolyl cis-trans isomerase SurA